VEATPSAPPQLPVSEVTRPFEGKAAIVLSDRSPAFENVATELENLLDQPSIYNLADKSQSPEDAFAAIAESDAAIVIAIGFSAARAATRWSTLPIIYCQVFNFSTEDEVPVLLKGVAAIPPLSPQVEAWKKLDPELARIGAILGDGHQDLVEEASSAAAANGVSFLYRTARSDRETLYLFKRMAPEIDGFWLFPDNRVLSLPVLRKMMDIAARHRVRVAVFNDALLELGVAFSSAAVESDIAAAIMSIAGEIASDRGGAVPDLTPLRDLRIRTGSPVRDSVGTVALGRTGAGGAAKGRL
jgi:hypothetical protein